jgi:hypothetical protein
VKNILHLNLHREFFAQIAARTKRIEYRQRTGYWKTRLEGRKYDFIQFRNGYATKAPEMLVEFLGVKKIQRRSEPHYAILLGRILNLKRWKPWKHLTRGLETQLAASRTTAPNLLEALVAELTTS